MTADPLPLAQALIRRPSVTPEDAGAQDVLAAALEAIGFTVTRLRFGAIANLYARRGTAGPHLCFAGHTDVVPPGDAAWAHAPFAGEVHDGMLYGRGACDMKGGIAAFVAACETPIGDTPFPGSLSLLITGDEEGVATDGTVRVLDWMIEHGERPDFCIVGEPTNPQALGDVIKIGRRGSLTADLTIHGIQGHSAYPARADNPIHRLTHILGALIAAPLDAGSDWFEPSTLQVTTIDVGNPAGNIIPAAARARLNIRFNDLHTGRALEAWLRATIARYAERFDLAVAISGESFLTEPGGHVATLRAAIAAHTGREPRLDTGGGTSDARFIARHFPVAEFGLVGRTMHQADECVPVEELRDLAAIYRRIIRAFGTLS